MQAQLKEDLVIPHQTVTEALSPVLNLIITSPAINNLIMDHPESIKKMDGVELEQFINNISALCDCV
jgi:hypothetical protein